MAPQSSCLQVFLSYLSHALQVGALNACFFAKRGFQVEVFEARGGRAAIRSDPSSLSIILSLSLTHEEAQSFQPESLCLMCLRYPAGPNHEGQEHQPGSVPQGETSPAARWPGGQGTSLRQPLASLHPEPETPRSGLVLPVRH